MPRAYSLDLRERAVRALDAGHAAPEVAELFGVSERTLFRWKAQRRMGGSLAPGTSPGQAPKIGPAQHDALRTQVAAHADATLAQHVALWHAATGVRVGIATMARTFATLGMTLKKSPARGGARSARPGRVAGGDGALGAGGARLRR
jgi:transposase